MIRRVVIFNAWVMSRDCPVPERFDPNKSLTPNGELNPQANQNNSLLIPFSLGSAEGTQMEWYDSRRTCSGRFFAENAFWAAAAISFPPLDLSYSGPTGPGYSKVIRHLLSVPSRAEHSSNRRTWHAAVRARVSTSYQAPDTPSTLLHRF